jgi:hypothetical protein
LKRGGKETDTTLPMMPRSFKLPAFVREYGTMSQRAAAEGLGHIDYLHALADVEAAERAERRVARLLEESKLRARPWGASSSSAYRRRRGPHSRRCATAASSIAQRTSSPLALRAQANRT